ncbi:MAG: DUF86 domain-containing protein [Epsilonproteobacteria bacterium]|jgi:uncharacterized protein with HEPN domain|nr:DUF86 domain-containing protein [Campylobacterota bacterium]
MYSDEDIVRLRSIDKKMDDIFNIIDRHKGIVETLQDIEGQPAVLMLLVAVSEQFSKLHKKDSNILNSFEQIDIKGMIDIRNFIAHDYDGVNLSIIEDSLRLDLPKIHQIVKDILTQS